MLSWLKKYCYSFVTQLLSYIIQGISEIIGVRGGGGAPSVGTVPKKWVA
jgi:hypothetical protein